MSHRVITRYLLPVILLAASAIVFAACEDDGKSADVTVAEPAATETGTGNDSGSGDSDEGGSADGEAEPSPDDSASPEASPTAGTGTITIGDMVFEYQVTFCSVEDDGSVLATGTGGTPDGQPFFAEAHISRDGVTANASVNVGVESGSAEGDPKWQGANVMDADVSTDDGLSLAFSTSFVDLRAEESAEMQGSVDVSCR